MTNCRGTPKFKSLILRYVGKESPDHTYTMQPIQENEEAADGGIARRRLLIAVDDSAESERALSWTLEELYRSPVVPTCLPTCSCQNSLLLRSLCSHHTHHYRCTRVNGCHGHYTVCSKIHRFQAFSAGKETSCTLST